MRRLQGTLAVMAVAILACQSSLTGNEGNFQFSYEADDRITDFNKPIAVGAKLDVDVADVGAGLPVEVLAAEFDDSSILEVVSFSESTVTIAGVGEGSALLSVEGTTASGETLTDAVNMLAGVPEVLTLSHTCAEGEQAYYLTGQRVWVPFEMEKANSQPVIGYGYYPVTLSDTAPMTLSTDESTQQLMAFDTSDTPGEVVLTSTIDETTLTMRVAAPSQITGAMEPVALVLEDIDVGDVNTFYVLPAVDGQAVCQAEVDKSVASDTPDICDVRDIDVDSVEHEHGWFEVEGVAEGTCLFTVSYPDGGDGAGVSTQFSYPIEP